jgi:hypothetical protein
MAGGEPLLSPLLAHNLGAPIGGAGVDALTKPVRHRRRRAPPLPSFGGQLGTSSPGMAQCSARGTTSVSCNGGAQRSVLAVTTQRFPCWLHARGHPAMTTSDTGHRSLGQSRSLPSSSGGLGWQASSDGVEAWWCW